MIEEYLDASIEPSRGMVITDFDGTIHSLATGVTLRDRKTLESLKERGILRVIATGRSPYSVDRVIDESFPVDYVIFSSGAGIMRLEGKRIIRSSFFTEEEVALICRGLEALSCDFMVFKPIPLNHYFFYHRSRKENHDFDRRLEIYDGCSEPLFEGVRFRAAQFLCIEPFNVSRYEMIRSEFPDCNVIRATSPIDGESLWVEIFPKGVNKGEASDWLSRKAMVSRDDCLVLGNDYNDIDMLSWARAARVVGNAPEDIKRMFPSVAPQAESGFSEAVESWLASRDIR
jgi:HAD superfamily hydrolase (TIGR01484 family)